MRAQRVTALVTKELKRLVREPTNLFMALINDPEVAFLDEPTVGLDPQSRRATWDLIRGLGDRGRTVVLTTHYI